MTAELEAADEESRRVTAEIKAALHNPECKLQFVMTFGCGVAIQVMLKTRKIGPMILPTDDQTTGDLLRMLADWVDEPAADDA